MPEPEIPTWMWGKAELREHPLRGWFVRIDGQTVAEVVPGIKYWSRRRDLVAILKSRGLVVSVDGWITLRKG